MLALFLVALLAPQAGDTEPPFLDHDPITTGSRDGQLTFRVNIIDESKLFAPSLCWRPVKATKYSVIELASDGSDLYTATLSSGQLSGDIEYYLEAYDEHGNGPARVGEPEKPLRIVGATRVPVRSGAFGRPVAGRTGVAVGEGIGVARATGPAGPRGFALGAPLRQPGVTTNKAATENATRVRGFKSDLARTIHEGICCDVRYRATGGRARSSSPHSMSNTVASLVAALARH